MKRVVLAFIICGLVAVLIISTGRAVDPVGAPSPDPDAPRPSAMVIANVGQYPDDVLFHVQSDAGQFWVSSEAVFRQDRSGFTQIVAYAGRGVPQYIQGKPHPTRLSFMANGRIYNDVPVWQSLQIHLTEVLVWAAGGNQSSVSNGYSTFIGTSVFDQAAAIAVDETGAAVIGIDSDSTTVFTRNSAENIPQHVTQGIVLKLNPDGSALDYIVNILGVDEQFVSAVALDSSGAAYVTGVTKSNNFTATLGAYDGDAPSNGLFKGYLLKVSPDGSEIEYSTLLGGSDEDLPQDVAVDAYGRVYITGSTRSHDFPTTEGAFDRSHSGGQDKDLFLTVLHPVGNGHLDLLYSTLLGGSADDSGQALGFDLLGNIYVVGNTSSADLPSTKTLGPRGSGDILVAKIHRAGCGNSDLAYALVLGSSGADLGEGIAVLANGSLILAGSASDGFPGGTGHNGSWDGLVAKVNAAGTNLNWTRFLGGSGLDFFSDLALESSGDILLAGLTLSSDLAVTDGSSLSGSQDILVGQVDSNGTVSDLAYFGGSAEEYATALDSYGLNLFVMAGASLSADYPVTSGAYDESHNGDFDAIVSRIELSNPETPTPVPTATATATPDPGSPPRIWLPVIQRSCEGSS
jgi:hypothetical protein